MIKDITSLTIKGGCFQKETTLELFRWPLNILYGRNGSGKSTIARAIKQIANEDNENATDSLLEVARFEDVELSEDDRKKIFVFDQDFIDQYVRLDPQDNGLKTIVMLGQQVELEDQIKAFEKDIEQKTNNVQFLDDKCKQLEQLTAQDATALSTALKERGNWVECVAAVNGKRPQVRSDRLIEFRNNTEYGNATELRREFERLLPIYLKSRSNPPITFRIDELHRRDLTTLQNKLQKKLLDPQLSEENKQLLDVIKRLSVTRLQEMQKDFQNPDLHQCPYCLQALDDDQKEDLNELISATLSREVENYTFAVNSLKEQTLQNVSLEIDKKLERDDAFKGLFADYRLAVQILNGYLQHAQHIVEKRLNNIYQPYNDDITQCNIDDSIRKVNACIKAINDKIEEFNQSVKEAAENKDHLIALAFLWAAAYNRPLIEKYNEDLEELEKTEQEKADSEKLLDQAKEKLNTLKAQQKNTAVARDEINLTLREVFGDDTRLQLALNNNGLYEIEVNGRPVKPKNVSTGERNIIALCYFFAHVYEKESPFDKYSKERLIVIDDPISSFDMDNKMGVLDFLRYEIKQICSTRHNNPNNTRSKVLIMSHDRQTINNIISLNYNFIHNGENEENKADLLVLHNHKLNLIPHSESEYKRIMNLVYQYASSSSTAHDRTMDLLIGNTIRRMLEAFAAFTCQCSSSRMFTNHGITRYLKTGKERNYFKHNISRILINDESHTAEAINAMHDGLELYTPDEKRRAAQDALVFIYIINSLHIEQCFPGRNIDGEWHDSEAVANIKKWREKISGEEN